MGSQRRAKATIQTQRAVLYPHSLWHKLLQCTKEAKTGERSSLVVTPCSPIDVPQGHEMHPRGFTASIKRRL